ncbi:MAG: DUF72 domain-containing protein [Thermoplasmata archaeon]
MIHIGCSGWNYPEWVGSIYRSRSDLFLQYSEHFNCVEINSSFYSFPSQQSVKSWIREGSTRRGFSFSIKMPGKITHELLLQDHEASVGEAVRFEREVLTPLKNAKMLIGCLVQLPPFLGIREWHKLTSMAAELDRDSFLYFVETRSSSLDVPQVDRSLYSLNLSRVLIDTPYMRIAQESNTGRIVYARLHGRNAEEWKSGNGMSKYDYSYSETELKEISLTLSGLSSTHDDIFVFFNNHPHGNAPANAMRLKEIMGIKDAQESLQKRLFF